MLFEQQVLIQREYGVEQYVSTLNIREMVPSASVIPIHPGALNYYREIGLIQ